MTETPETPEHQQQDPEQPAGRIGYHGRGAGPLTPEEIEERARELALIAGRGAAHVNDDDRRRAQQELNDELLDLADKEARSTLVASSNPADMAVETGRRVQETETADEQNIMEEEIKEGVREAEHERMLGGQAQEDEIQ